MLLPDAVTACVMVDACVVVALALVACDRVCEYDPPGEIAWLGVGTSVGVTVWLED